MRVQEDTVKTTDRLKAKVQKRRLVPWLISGTLRGPLRPTWWPPVKLK